MADVADGDEFSQGSDLSQLSSDIEDIAAEYDLLKQDNATPRVPNKDGLDRDEQRRRIELSVKRM